MWRQTATLDELHVPYKGDGMLCEWPKFILNFASSQTCLIEALKSNSVNSANALLQRHSNVNRDICCGCSGEK